MLRKTKTLKQGSIIFLEHTSQVLKDNPLGDPHVRTVPVYLPWQYNSAKSKYRNFPVLYDLAGFTSSGPGRVNWKNFGESIPERLDRLIAHRKLSPVVIVFPDCFTSFGGNQYIDSPAIGNYAGYLTQELIPFIDRELKSIADREHRGCFGKSSGGYGALIHGMKYTKFWGAIANHSGDAYFDFIYKSEWPAVLTHLENFKSFERLPSSEQNPGHDDGRIAKFLSHVRDIDNPTSRDIMTLMMLAMAASYDPDLTAPNSFQLPFNLNTGELNLKRWKNWLLHDPVNLVTKYTANLRKLSGLYMDCGSRDQFHIHFGSRQISKSLNNHNVNHHYEEFDGTHSGIDHRLDISLPFLMRHLK